MSTAVSVEHTATVVTQKAAFFIRLGLKTSDFAVVLNLPLMFTPLNLVNALSKCTDNLPCLRVKFWIFENEIIWELRVLVYVCVLGWRRLRVRSEQLRLIPDIFVNERHLCTSNRSLSVGAVGTFFFVCSFSFASLVAVRFCQSCFECGLSRLWLGKVTICLRSWRVFDVLWTVKNKCLFQELEFISQWVENWFFVI
jgi:hypothetical protein